MTMANVEKWIKNELEACAQTLKDLNQAKKHQKDSVEIDVKIRETKAVQDVLFELRQWIRQQEKDYMSHPLGRSLGRASED